MSENTARLPDLRFTTRAVSPEEKAAVEIVLDALIAEESAQEHAVSSRGQTAWQVSQRQMRKPIEPAVNFGVDFGA